MSRWILAAGALAAACATPPGPLPEGARLDVVREVGAVQDSFQAAIERRDAQAYLGFLAPPVEFRFARDGELARSLHQDAPAAFAAVDSLACTWPDRTVTVLSRDAATMTVTYRCAGRSTDGSTWSGGGAWTNVYHRRADRWVIVEAHESHLPTPRP